MSVGALRAAQPGRAAGGINLVRLGDSIDARGPVDLEGAHEAQFAFLPCEEGDRVEPFVAVSAAPAFRLYRDGQFSAGQLHYRDGRRMRALDAWTRPIDSERRDRAPAGAFAGDEERARARNAFAVRFSKFSADRDNRLRARARPSVTTTTTGG